MKENYQRQLDTLLEQLPKDKVPTLLLHSCCGPCSTYVLQYLSKYFQISVYFYNPNIMPRSEYGLRLETQKKVLSEMTFPHPVKLVEAPYDLDTFLEKIKGYENEPERGKRCDICMEMRICKSAEYAAENNFDFFCTTLSVSPHKDAVLLHTLSQKYADIYSVTALPADFKKKSGYLTSVSLSKELGLYRQNYCGCIFSKSKSDDYRSDS